MEKNNITYYKYYSFLTILSLVSFEKLIWKNCTFLLFILSHFLIILFISLQSEDLKNTTIWLYFINITSVISTSVAVSKTTMWSSSTYYTSTTIQPSPFNADFITRGNTKIVSILILSKLNITFFQHSCNPIKNLTWSKFPIRFYMEI